MNALTLLKQDHGNVENFFRRFEEAAPDDHGELAAVRDLLVEHLSAHAAVEEQLFYPAVRERLGAEDAETVLEGLEEHHIVKWTLSELHGMSPSDERFRPKLTVLAESVRHHVEEEEQELFPKVRKAFTVKELEELGAGMEDLKRVAPTRPHPRTPDTPPLNILVGIPAALIDRTIQTGREAVGKLLRRPG